MTQNLNLISFFLSGTWKGAYDLQKLYTDMSIRYMQNPLE